MEHGFVYYGSVPFLGYPTAVMLLIFKSEVMAACSRCDAAFLFLARMVPDIFKFGFFVHARVTTRRMHDCRIWAYWE
jgi:hypothetical protein